MVNNNGLEIVKMEGKKKKSYRTRDSRSVNIGTELRKATETDIQKNEMQHNQLIMLVQISSHSLHNSF